MKDRPVLERARMAAQSEDAATAVEYALMVALVTLAIATVVGNLGITLDGIFGDEALLGALSL